MTAAGTKEKLKSDNESSITNATEIELTYKTVRSTELLNASSARMGSIQALNEAKSNRFQLANQGGAGKAKTKTKIAGKPQRLRKSARPDNVLLGHMSQERKIWLFAVTVLTGWVPNFLLRRCGINGQDVIQAWREKFALCMLVVITSVLAIGWLEVSSSLLCPQVPNALTWDKVVNSTNLVVANGKVLDVTRSQTSIGRVLQRYIGKDVSNIFPAYARLGHPSLNSSAYVDTAIQACVANPAAADRWLSSRVNSDWSRTLRLTEQGRLVGCPRPGGPLGATEPCFYSDSAWRDFNRMVIADLLLDRRRLGRTFNETDKPNYAVILSKAYDVTQFIRHTVLFQTDNPNLANFETVAIVPRMRTMFFPLEVTVPLARAAGKDVSALFSQSSSQKYITCLDKLFYAGRITPEVFETICGIGNPLLLVCSGMVYSIVVIKFLVSIMFQFGARPAQMNAYCLCFVPCYTEGYSMRVTLETLAQCDYDDTKKLIVVVCDGNIKGKGNPAPTPQIALDMLGWKGEEPEPKLVHALGKGSDKINMCKAYSGWYKYKNHQVPYVVIAKVGKPDEAKKPKPGNRGKRDSQLILMNFFNKLVHKREMSPFEYDLYYHVKHVIGVDPKLYEYCLMVDADTMVEPDSMNELIAAMVNDQRKIGVCGETMVANKWTSWVTAIQVHEYYINHHLGKAFESMFGSVTCLPGCFSMYRVSNAKGEAFLVNDVILEDYKINKVHTLHSKNLLHLGEDRYLTTLLLKHFPNHRLEFIPTAVCHTDIPDSFSVLLSQRRRWINSTFHNLYEVMKLPRLCQVCFISMKTLVFMDLLSTLILPASTLYLYSIVIRACIAGIDQYGVVLLGAAGLYLTHLFIILLVKKQYEYVLWITVYVTLAMPVFSIILPLYSFWHFDDFSWGATRLIEGADDGHHDGDATGLIKNIDTKMIHEWEQSDPRMQQRLVQGSAASTSPTSATQPAGMAPTNNGGMVMMGQAAGGGHVMGPMMFMPQQGQQQQQPMMSPVMVAATPQGYMMFQPMVMSPHMSPAFVPMSTPAQEFNAQRRLSGTKSPPPEQVEAQQQSGRGSSPQMQIQPQPTKYQQQQQVRAAPDVGQYTGVAQPMPYQQQQQVPQPVQMQQQTVAYPAQGLAAGAGQDPMVGTVGQAFDQLFRDLQGQEGIEEESRSQGSGPLPYGGATAVAGYQKQQQPPYQAYQQPPQQYQQQQVPAYYGQAAPQTYENATPAQQPPEDGYQTQSLQQPQVSATMFGGGTVGAAFAEAFKSLQDD